MLPFTNRSNAEAAVVNLLKYLTVNIYTDNVIGELEKHPDYPSMLAVSDVLTALNIENSAFRAEFEMLGGLPCPFLVNLNSNGGEFAVVSKMDAKQVYFSDERKEGNKLSLSDFKSTFAGVVLVAERNAKFIEESSKLSYAYKFKPAVIPAGFLMVLITLLYSVGYFSNLSWLLLMLSVLKTSGVIISILLLIQSIDTNNPMVQVLCQGGGKTDCNSILSSKAAKVFEGLTWSEVGFFYFTGTWLLLLFGSGSLAVITILALLNFVSLPYTVYSINYQARIAKNGVYYVARFRRCCGLSLYRW